MGRRRKVTFTVWVSDTDDDRTIGRKATARRIRSIALRRGEKFADWAQELGVSRAFISNVVAGRKQTQYVREFIEARLGTTIWPAPERTAA